MWFRASPSRTRRLAVWSLAACAAYGLLVAHSALVRQGPAATPLAPGFAGSAACAKCHAEIAAEHSASNHAHTLRPAEAAEATGDLPAPLWIQDPDLPLAYQITKRIGKLGTEAQVGSETLWQPADWAFGTGTQGMTLVGRAADGRYVESPLSFYRRAGWDFTVGFLARPPAERRVAPTGTPMRPSEVAECFQCHTTGTRVEGESIRLEGAQPGVQCESCHGPGKAHAEAAGARRPEMMLQRRASAASEVELCGTCHRKSLPAGVKAEDPVAVRFAPAGFIRSRCFRESRDRFGCSSCHNPHTNAATEPAHYRRVCGGCHGAGPEHSVCPVQPRGDCVSCHMPKKIVQRHSLFTDHWIRKPQAAQ